MSRIPLNLPAFRLIIKLLDTAADSIQESIGSIMKILIVEDDFISRKILHKVLSDYGECDVAVDGEEALAAISQALDSKEPYKLVCLDIMLPNIDGQEVLRRLRKMEADRGIALGDTEHGMSVVMTTSLEEPKHFMQSMRSGCEGYVPKPIDRQRLLKTLREIGLVKDS